MKQPPETDPTLALIDAVLHDLSLRSAMYIGRRREDGDLRTFVIQTGEEGRHRLNLPDLRSDASIEAVVAEAQAHLEDVLSASAPLCPRHDHALRGRAANGTLTWLCPAREWQCAQSGSPTRADHPVSIPGLGPPKLAWMQPQA